MYLLIEELKSKKGNNKTLTQKDFCKDLDGVDLLRVVADWSKCVNESEHDDMTPLQIINKFLKQFD